MVGSSLSVDLFLGGIVTIVLLALLILKEFVSASENPDLQRIGSWLYIPIIPLLFLFFILAGYRALLVLGLLPEPRVEDPVSPDSIMAASETITPFEPFVINMGLTQTPSPTPTNSPSASKTPSPTQTVTETPRHTARPNQRLPANLTLPTNNPSPTNPPVPTNTPVPPPTDSPEPTEPELEPTIAPTATEPPPPDPEPTATPPSPNPTPTSATTEPEDPPGGRPTPTPAPAPH